MWYESLDPKQGYNHAEFERPPLICLPSAKKPMLKCCCFFKSENCPLSFSNMCKSEKQWYIFTVYFDLLNNPTKLQLNQI